ncbi:Possible surface protein, responsible for cell interaction; contains cell adhesion domain and ChW-repeats [Yersinia phage fHe-Yen9-04]|uniref:Possible surface protein, responsible for cell interaction contains cell adhesion domain and ChW-repeats n=1 Tax=Yersinia phage fHe-Yen9-04 TaxID=2052742 RepID=A0A2C9CX52_9CAUD|nr:major tail protein [Yersinia phage fHe-Yen9-04]SOK58371.1 Possible surface protein, responsible for cell interaction; contains cell adhesion domain and ChW-repeats [Yersinia phage fHe-Yen9-04]VUE36140.1 Possible surface protein, responsible for cell interaction; contains cell adhesion domain and ChW-repeats [Yersinia phage fHe-Yen9-04]
MGKPIAGRNKSPFGVDGINIDAAVLEDGTKLTNIRISKQRSINMFDLLSADGATVYPFVQITGVDKTGADLDVADTGAEIADKLANGTFCISIKNTSDVVVGFAIRLLLNKVILQDGSTLFLNNYQGQGEDPVSVIGVSVTPATAALNVGQTQQLSAVIDPVNATNKSVGWTSSAPTIASVSDSGLVSALLRGSATITASTVDGSHTDTSVITVSDVYVIDITPNPATVAVSGTANISVSGSKNGEGYPMEASFVSSDPLIFTVSGSGTSAVITGVAAGNATLTISEGSAWSRTVQVTVTA